MENSKSSLKEHTGHPRGPPSAKKRVAGTDQFEAANGVTAATNGVTAATSKKCGFKNLTLQIQVVAFNTGKT